MKKSEKPFRVNIFTPLYRMKLILNKIIKQKKVVVVVMIMMMIKEVA